MRNSVQSSNGEASSCTPTKSPVGADKQFRSSEANSTQPNSALDPSILAAPLRRRGTTRDTELNVPGIDAKGDDLGGGACWAYRGERLYWFDELPVVLRYNKHIKSGYRAGMTYKQCFCSMFQYHNETGNIHTHFVPLVVSVIMLLSGLWQPWPLARAEFLQNVLPISICLLGSTLYHTCMANHHHYKIWLHIDVCGVFVLFLGTANLLVAWGLPCHQQLAGVFITVYYIVGTVAVVSALRASSPLWRGMPMLMLFAMRVMLFVLRVWTKSGSQLAVGHYITAEVLAFIGGLLNSLRIPEKWFPAKDERSAGPFDYWLNSHQLMHILVFLGMCQMHRAAYDDYRYWIMTDGQCLQ